MQLMSGGAAAAMPAVDEGGSILERLKGTADRLATLDEETRAERRRRDELVTAARDQSFSWSTIARAARCSITRCVAIVAGD